MLCNRWLVKVLQDFVTLSLIVRVRILCWGQCHWQKTRMLMSQISNMTCLFTSNDQFSTQLAADDCIVNPNFLYGCFVFFALRVSNMHGKAAFVCCSMGIVYPDMLVTIADEQFAVTPVRFASSVTICFIKGGSLWKEHRHSSKSNWKSLPAGTPNFLFYFSSFVGVSLLVFFTAFCKI